MTNTVVIDDTATTDGELPCQAEPVVGIDVEQLDISHAPSRRVSLPEAAGPSFARTALSSGRNQDAGDRRLWSGEGRYYFSPEHRGIRAAA